MLFPPPPVVYPMLPKKPPFGGHRFPCVGRQILSAANRTPVGPGGFAQKGVLLNKSLPPGIRPGREPTHPTRVRPRAPPRVGTPPPPPVGDTMPALVLTVNRNTFWKRGQVSIPLELAEPAL